VRQRSAVGALEPVNDMVRQRDHMVSARFGAENPLPLT
jgi:hypothetical protein